MGDAAPLRTWRWLSVCLVTWWAALAAQVWYAWDLNEVYAECLSLLMMGPETPFALVGVALGLLGLVGGLRRRAWVRSSLQLLTLVTGIWLLVASPVMRLGASLYLWRNHDRFLAEVATARAAIPPGVVRDDMPAREGVFIEGSPPRFGFEQRWIGMFHWAALVYDPDRTIDAQARQRAQIFQYSMLGHERLREDWYLVWAMK
jgi:hypothetical protein